MFLISSYANPCLASPIENDLLISKSSEAGGKTAFFISNAQIALKLP